MGADTLDWIVELPDLILEEIASKLNTKELQQFRLTCRRFYEVSLSKLVLEKVTIDFRKVKEEDLNSMFSFLETIDYGRFGKFVTADRRFYESMSDNMAKECIKFAKNLRTLTCDISLSEHLVRSCPLVKHLTLEDIETMNQYHNLSRRDKIYKSHPRDFSNMIVHFTSLQHLQELEIQGIGKVPVSLLNSISKNNVLTKFSASYGCLYLDDGATVKATLINDVMQPTVEIKRQSISHWSFGHITTESFKLILPVSAVSITKSYSPNILWHPQSTNLKKIEANEKNLHDFKQVFPQQLQQLHLKLPFSVDSFLPVFLSNVPAGIPDSMVFSNFANITNYNQLTISRTLQPEVIRKLLCSNETNSSLATLHLINCPVDSITCGGRETYSTHAFEWFDNDIANIMSCHPQMSVLVLENFCDITFHVIELLSKLKGRLNLLRLINCKGFRGKNANTMKSNSIGFKIDLVEDVNSRWSRYYFENFERKLKRTVINNNT